MTNTRSSRRISSAMASRSDSRTVNDVDAPVTGVAALARACGAGTLTAGCSAGAAGSADATSGIASPASSIKIAIVALTATFSAPAGTNNLPIIPSSMVSTSIVVLSVSISAMISPDRT